MRTEQRSPRLLVLLLVAGLWTGCASASAGGATATNGGSTDARDSDGPACQEDCTLRVENRLDRDVTVSTDRQASLPALGVVRRNRTASFELTGFTGQQLEIWIRDEDSDEIVGVSCVRAFPNREGRLVLGAEVSDFGC